MIDGLRADTFIDAVQTAAIIVNSAALIYVILRLEGGVRDASKLLGRVREMEMDLKRRVDGLEQRETLSARHHRRGDAGEK